MHDLLDGPDAGDERRYRDGLLDRLAGGRAALLVDDAQWLDPASLRVLVGVVERAADRAVTVAVAHRPAPGDATLAALDAAVARRQPLVALSPLDEAAVGERAALVLGAGRRPPAGRGPAEQAAACRGDAWRWAAPWPWRAWTADGTCTGGRPPAEPGPPPGRRWWRPCGPRSTSFRRPPAPRWAP